MTEDTSPEASVATDERIAKALERIADSLEAITWGDEEFHVWVRHVSDAGEDRDGSPLGYIKVVTRDDP